MQPHSPGARALSDALEVQGIENEVREDGDGHGVWVIDDEDLEAARAVAAGPDRDATVVRAEADRIRAQREEDAKPIRVAGTASAQAVRGPAGQVTIGLILLCVAVGVLTQLGGDRSSPVMQALTIVPYEFDG